MTTSVAIVQDPEIWGYHSDISKLLRNRSTYVPLYDTWNHRPEDLKILQDHYTRWSGHCKQQHGEVQSCHCQSRTWANHVTLEQLKYVCIRIQKLKEGKSGGENGFPCKLHNSTRSTVGCITWCVRLDWTWDRTASHSAANKKAPRNDESLQ